MKKPIKSLLMKCSFLLLGLLFGSQLMAAGGVTQDLSKTIIPIQLKNASLKQAFHQIESETKLLFSFKTADVSAHEHINYSSAGVAVATLLKDLLNGTDLQYEQLDNNIIIKKISLTGAVSQIPDFSRNPDLFQGGVHGKIIDDKGEPVGAASISISGLKRGAAANEQGEFNLSGLKAGTYTLQISAVGYVTQTHSVEVTENGVAEISIVLKTDNSTLNDVVVTALGIKRSVKSLGYASQEVNAAELTASHQPNLINALQGKVAGVTISSAGGGPGQGASILIRGVNSLNPAQNNQPLFVVDGIPIDNSTSDLGTTGGRGVQMSNRASDINPDDIETINILRGGAATALYGLRGSNGVVVITTKSAKAGTMRVNYSANYSIDEGDKFPKVQKTYTQGFHGVYDTTSFWPTWGPTVAEAKAIDPTHPDELFDQYKHAYVQGNQFRNSLSLSGGTDKASLSSSVSYSNQNGVLPFTYYKDVSARLSGRLKFSDQFSMGADILYANNSGNAYDADRFNEEMTYWAPRWDVRDYLKPDGTLKENPSLNGNAWYKAATNKFISQVSHTIASGYAVYAPLKWLTATYRFGIDQYNDDRTASAPGPKGLPGEIVDEDNEFGFIGKYHIMNRQLNSNFLLTLDHKWGKFGTTLRLGNDVFDTRLTQTSVRGDTLDVYNFFNLSNAKKITASNYLRQYRIVGAYGELALSYDEFLFLSITGRNDWTSTLEEANRSFFYPSASLSYIFTQQFQTLPSWLTYGKFRASLAGIGKDASPYSTSTYYSTIDINSSGTSVQLNPIGGVNRWTRYNAGGIAALKPEFTTTFEIGTDLSFFRDRISFGFTWYKSNSRDQIIPVATAPSTGYNSITLNAGEIENKGIEISLNVKPVVSKNFSWNLGLNVSHNENKVLSIYGGLTQLTVGTQSGYSNSSVTMNYIPGESVGDIFGTPWSRYYANGDPDPLHVDKSRPLLIGADGYPLLTPSSNQKILGNSYPKWIAGINNSFTYKSFNLSFLFDGHFNVRKFDQLNNYMSAFGIADYTLNRNQTVKFKGVLADGTENNTSVWLGQGVGPDGVDHGDGYYRKVYRGISENFVEDASFIKLRTLTLTYSLNPKWLDKTFVKAASVGFTGNNLWIHTKYLGFDPESSSSPAGSNANGFAGFTYPALRSFMFNINVTF